MYQYMMNSVPPLLLRHVKGNRKVHIALGAVMAYVIAFALPYQLSTPPA